MKQLRFAVFGAGFWAPYQLAGWQEVGGARCVAICNRTLAKAEAMAHRFQIPTVYSDPEKLFTQERLDFVDIITEVEAHEPLVLLAAKHRVPVICQKPMAPSLAAAERMVESCRRAAVPFFVHENWRWQSPIRAIKQFLNRGQIGNIFRARLLMISGCVPWINQPALRELTQFILTDLGTHLLDVARFYFGEARTVYCQTHQTLTELQGENVATIMLSMNQGRTTVLCELAYAKTPLERECFPQTLAFFEGDKGSLELAPDFWVRLTTRKGVWSRRYPPPRYPWANPSYDIAHASIVPCLANLLGALQKRELAETTGEDNLQTMRLVFGAYESARKNQVVRPRVSI